MVSKSDNQCDGRFRKISNIYFRIKGLRFYCNQSHRMPRSYYQEKVLNLLDLQLRKFDLEYKNRFELDFKCVN